MACPCGSHTLKHRSSVHTDAIARYELTYRECDRCGRQGYEQLSSDNVNVCSGPAARQQYAHVQEGPLADWLDKVAASLYRPYKLWRTPDGREVHVCLIKLDHQVAAICPEFRLLISGDDYLEASFALVRKLRDCLDLPPYTKLTTTDSPPFELTWGHKPTFARQTTDRLRMQPIESSATIEATPTEPCIKTSADKPLPVPERTPEIAKSEEPSSPGQLDLFG